MTPAETIELGHLLERHQRDLEAAQRSAPSEPADILSHEELQRLATLSVRAHRELPHDDPATPGVDEGRTPIVQEMITAGEWQDRLVAIERFLLRLVETLGTQLGAAAVGALQAEVDKLLTRR